MYAAAMRVELLMRGVSSLKEKRRLMTAIVNQLQTMRVGVAEVDHQGSWQRSAIGVAVVAPQFGQLERILLGVRKAIEAQPGVEILDHVTSHLDRPE